MSLDAAARRRYARQLLLGEIGQHGQERLLGAGFRQGVESDADAYAVAAEYLVRAGCPHDEEQGQELRVPSEGDVLRFAGDPALREPAGAVLGAVAAVEHLKKALGLGAGEASFSVTLGGES